MINKQKQIKDAELVKLQDGASFTGKKLMKIVTFCPAFTNSLILKLAEEYSTQASEEFDFWTKPAVTPVYYGSCYWEDLHMLESATSNRTPTTL